MAPAHVGLDVRIERIEPIEAEGRRRRTASVCSAGHGAPATDPPSRAPWSCISATRTASRPNGEIWTSRVLRGSSMTPDQPLLRLQSQPPARQSPDSRRIAHRMVGEIRGCSVTAPAPDPQIALLLPVIENTYESRVMRDVWRQQLAELCPRIRADARRHACRGRRDASFCGRAPITAHSAHYVARRPAALPWAAVDHYPAAPPGWITQRRGSISRREVDLT